MVAGGDSLLNGGLSSEDTSDVLIAQTDPNFNDFSLVEMEIDSIIMPASTVDPVLTVQPGDEVLAMVSDDLSGDFV